MTRPSLHETVLREFCKSSPSAAQALDELLAQNARLITETRLLAELRSLAETCVDGETPAETLKGIANRILGYA